MEMKLTGGETKLLWKGPGFGQGWDVIVSGLLMLCEQDTERGRQSSINTLLAEVSERAYPKPSREEADRLKQEVSLLPHSPRLSCCDYPQVLISPVMGAHVFYDAVANSSFHEPLERGVESSVCSTADLFPSPLRPSIGCL